MKELTESQIWALIQVYKYYVLKKGRCGTCEAPEQTLRSLADLGYFPSPMTWRLREEKRTHYTRVRRDLTPEGVTVAAFAHAVWHW